MVFFSPVAGRKQSILQDMCFVEAEGGKFMWVLIEGSFSYIRAANLYKPGTQRAQRRGLWLLTVVESPEVWIQLVTAIYWWIQPIQPWLYFHICWFLSGWSRGDWEVQRLWWQEQDEPTASPLPWGSSILEHQNGVRSVGPQCLFHFGVTNWLKSVIQWHLLGMFGITFPLAPSESQVVFAGTVLNDHGWPWHNMARAHVFHIFRMLSGSNFRSWSQSMTR